MDSGNYNIFIELGLTPPLPEPDVKAALDKKINHWNNMRTRQPIHKEKWEHFKRIKADVAANPNLIAEHAARFAAEKGRELEEKKTALRKAANLYVVNGRIEEAQLKLLSRQFADFSEAEILKILGAELKAERKFSYSEDPTVQETPAIVLKPISDLLRQAGKRDLYDFLNVSPTASKAQIQQVCDALYRSSQTSGSLTERTMNSSLVGHARNLLLSSDASRAGYDKALSNAGFAPVKEQMKALALGSTKVIAPSQYTTLLQQVTQAGIPRNKAEYLIFTEAKSLGLTIVEDAADTVVCRFCGSINDKNAASCKTCGMPMVIICPNCGNRSDNPEELRCTRCGFAIGDMPRAVTAAASAEKAISFGNFAEAEHLVTAAQAAWPGYKGLDTMLRRISEAKAEASKIASRLRALCSEKKYYTARREMGSSTSGDLESIAREISRAIEQAEAALSQAQRTSDPNTRLSLYCQALDYASDCDTAARFLKLTPPAAPARISVSVDGRNVHIEWTKASISFLRYVVVRKPDARPTSASDGTVIGETAGNSIDDVTTEPGRSYFYSVFSRCGDVTSTSGTSSDYPAMTVREIDPADIDFDLKERQIDFTFKSRSNIHAIEILRDGVKLASVIGQTYRDVTVTPDVSYIYRFIAIYRDITGREVRSSGTELTLTPMSMPSPVDLSVSREAANVILRWTKPSKGMVTVFTSDKPFGLSRGEKISIDTLRATPIRVSGFSAEIPLNFNGIRYLLPVTVVGNIGIAGKEEVIKNLKEPSDIAVTVADRKATIRWRSDGSASTLVEWSIDGGRTQQREFMSSDRQEVVIDLPADARGADLSLSSFVTLPSGKKEYGSPVRRSISLKPARVEFLDFSSDALFGFIGKDKFSVSVRCDSRPASDLAIILKEGSVPVDLVNYNPAVVIRQADFTPGDTIRLSLRYSRRNSSQKLFARLIAIDRAAASSIIITPESRNIK